MERLIGTAVITLKRVVYTDLGYDYGLDGTDPQNFREVREYAGQPMTASVVELTDWDGDNKLIYRVSPEELQDATGLNFGRVNNEYGWTYTSEYVYETGETV